MSAKPPDAGYKQRYMVERLLPDPRIELKTELHVMMALVDFHSWENQCRAYPGYELLLKKACVSRRTLPRALKKLKEAGLIRVTGSRRTGNKYYLDELVGFRNSLRSEASIVPPVGTTDTHEHNLAIVPPVGTTVAPPVGPRTTYEPRSNSEAVNISSPPLRAGRLSLTLQPPALAGKKAMNDSGGYGRFKRAGLKPRKPSRR